jgi:hypothetical protein
VREHEKHFSQLESGKSSLKLINFLERSGVRCRRVVCVPTMNKIEQIADAILYEGYNLFPFRKSALKNQKRFNFGIVSPKTWAENKTNESFFQRTECLIFSEKKDFTISLKTRFLQIENSNDDWQATIPREVENDFNLSEILDHEKTFKFNFSTEKKFLKINGAIKVSVAKLDDKLFKFTLILENSSEINEVKDSSSEDVLPISFLSTHSIFEIKNGKFVSLLETPTEFELYAKTCENVGTFPVLVGDKEKQNYILSSPIILYDFPAVAENSFDNFFDGTEIDELMVLSILALTDEEKSEVRKTDEKAAAILDKLENAKPEELMKLHAQMLQK